MERASDSQISNFSHSLSIPSEPPDIRNWFPSYQYESFVWDTYDEFGGSIFKEIECDGDGFVLVGERNGEKEGHLGDSKRSDDKHEDQFLSKMPDSLYSSSIPSEPPHIRNWFPSYETPALDNDNDDFEESVVKESASEDGFAIKGSNKDTEENFQESRNSGNSNEVGAGEKLYPNGFVKCKSSFGDVDENKSLCKIPDSPQSSSFPSEPPDIRNWFSGYVYESPVLGESDEFAIKETECEEDDFVNQNGNKEKEMNLKKIGLTQSLDELVADEKVQLNGFLKFNSSLGDDEQENQSLNKGNRVAGKENSSTLDSLCCKRVKQNLENGVFPFANRGISRTKDMEKSSLDDEGHQCKQQQKQNCPREAGFVSLKSNTTASNNYRKSSTKLIFRKDFMGNLEAKAQTEVGHATGSNMRYIQVTGASIENSTQGSNVKENGGNVVSGEGFVTTRKGRITGPNDENSLKRPQEILLEFSRNKGRTSTVGEKERKVLSERTNFEHCAVNEVRGKWQRPQKSKPSVGPPLKQLRLEQWVRRL